MGDRAQVHFEDTGAWLYTHWGGRTLPEVVRQALARDERWNDPEYLARIVFDEMTGDDTSATGFGIGTEQLGGVTQTIHIDCSEQEVRLVREQYTTKTSNEEVHEFEEFVNLDKPLKWPDYPE